MLLKRKEKEFNETIEHLQSDMDTLEKEKAELKEKLMQSSKKVLLEGLTKSAVSSPAPFLTGQQAAAHSPAVTAESASSARDSPLLLKEIEHLREALRWSQQEKARLVAKDLQGKLNSLPPIKPAKKTIEASPQLSEVCKLLKEAEELHMVSLVYYIITES